MNKLPFGIAAFMVLAAVSCTAPAQRTSQDETANWKTYTNDKFGFSFKYPSDVRMYESSTEKDLESPLIVELVGGANPYFAGAISILKYQRPEIPLQKVSQKNVKVGGIATVYKTGELNLETGLVLRKVELFLNHQGNPFYIDFAYGKPEQERIVEKILSTFTFTN